MTHAVRRVRDEPSRGIYWMNLMEMEGFLIESGVLKESRSKGGMERHFESKKQNTG